MDKPYVVRLDKGYFVSFVQGRFPHLASDPIEATRFTEREADGIIGLLSRIGFVGELVHTKYDKLPDIESTDE